MLEYLLSFRLQSINFFSISMTHTSCRELDLEALSFTLSAISNIRESLIQSSCSDRVYTCVELPFVMLTVGGGKYTLVSWWQKRREGTVIFNTKEQGDLYIGRKHLSSPLRLA